MTQNQFAGGPQVNEKEPVFNEKGEDNTEELQNMEPGGGLYKSFNPEDLSEANDNENTQKIEEHPNTPLIDGFIKKGLLSEEEGKIIKNVLIKDGDIEDNLEDLNISKDKIQNIIDSINYLGSEEVQENNNKNFNIFFKGNIDGFKTEVEGGEKELIGRNEDLINTLGSNFFGLGGDEANNETTKEALDRAFEITLNQLMEGKQFLRPSSFEDMKKIVNNSELSFEDRFKELKSIDSLINSDQSRSNAKQSKAFGIMKKGSEKKVLTLKGRFDEIKLNLQKARDTQNQEQIDIILDELIVLKEEAEISGDIFISSDIELLTQSISEGKEQN